MYYLMIKEIDQTGMKYLCKRKLDTTRPTEHLTYKGSGILWRRILRAHPEYTITTTVLGLFDEDQLRVQGLHYSNMYDVVNDPGWANLIKEQGDGGDTSMTEGYRQGIKNRTPDPLNGKRKTIHHPGTGEIRRILPDDPLPPGFAWGNATGLGFGPRPGACKVYNDGTRKIYVPKGTEPPDGFTPGLHYAGTTKGKQGYFHPETKHKVYLAPGVLPPPGYVQGLPPTTGLLLSTPHGVYNSVQECMRALGLTRYQITQNIKTKEGWFYL